MEKSHKDWNPSCLVPWVHAYMHTSGTRQLCCISGEMNTKSLEPLEEFWNGDYLRDTRKKMLRREVLPECKSCVNQVSPLSEFFNRNYKDLVPDLKKNTKEDGSLTSGPVAFDYRLSNLCNFKCYMCSSHNSTSWQKEVTETKGEAALPDWLQGKNFPKVKKFHEESSIPELFRAIENRSIREIYWTGGEPLLNEFHWRAMQMILDLGLEKQVRIRYNTNLSALSFKGVNFVDLIEKFDQVEIYASLDATGKIGEYLRTGLKWERWLENLNLLLPISKDKKIYIDHRMTTFGLFDLKNMIDLSVQSNLPVISNIVMNSSIATVMRPLSPMVFPREICDRLISETLEEISPFKHENCSRIFEVLESFFTSPTYGELYPETYEKALRLGMKKMLAAEQLRNRGEGNLGMFDILEQKPYLVGWLKKFI